MIWQPAKRLARSVLSNTDAGSRWLWQRANNVTVTRPTGEPNAPWCNAVLLSKAEANSAVAQLQRLGLPAMQDHPKNWDSLAALDLILKKVDRNAPILDAGSERYSMILPWLAMYGYRQLRGCNLVFDKPSRMGPVRYEYGDITRTTYADAAFQAVTCLSVIEHGVDLSAYFREMARIVKPNGLLITSTDYFETPVDTRGKTAYGVPIKIFDRNSIEETFTIARRCGFELLSTIDLRAGEKVVNWGQHGLWYTFIVFSMVRRGT